MVFHKLLLLVAVLLGGKDSLVDEELLGLKKDRLGGVVCYFVDHSIDLIES